jgi:hypothetical protein
MKDTNILFIILGVVHFFFAVIMGIYGFIFRKNNFDLFYLFYNLIVAMSWSFYNGECILTYWIKKYRDPEYTAGVNPTDLADMYLLLGSKELVYLIMSLGIVSSPISFYIVFKRNHFPFYIYFPYCISFLLYNFLLRFISLKKQGNLYNNVQNIFKVIFTVLFLLALHFVYKKNII